MIVLLSSSVSLARLKPQNCHLCCKRKYHCIRLTSCFVALESTKQVNLLVMDRMKSEAERVLVRLKFGECTGNDDSLL